MDPRHIRDAFGPPRPRRRRTRCLALLARAAAEREDRHLHERVVQRVDARAHTRPDRATPARGALQEIRQHEQMLATKASCCSSSGSTCRATTQKARLKALERDPSTRWRVTDDDRRALTRYSKSHELWEHMLRETSTAAAPWYVVEGADERYRNLTVGKILLDALQRTIAAHREAAPRRHGRAARAVGDRQRQADPRPRPHAEGFRRDVRGRARRTTRRGSPG